jgi:hypothetical protein
MLFLMILICLVPLRRPATVLSKQNKQSQQLHFPFMGARRSSDAALTTINPYKQVQFSPLPQEYGLHLVRDVTDNVRKDNRKRSKCSGPWWTTTLRQRDAPTQTTRTTFKETTQRRCHKQVWVYPSPQEYGLHLVRRQPRTSCKFWLLLLPRGADWPGREGSLKMCVSTSYNARQER